MDTNYLLIRILAVHACRQLVPLRQQVETAP